MTTRPDGQSDEITRTESYVSSNLAEGINEVEAPSPIEWEGRNESLHGITRTESYMSSNLAEGINEVEAPSPIEWEGRNESLESNIVQLKRLHIAATKVSDTVEAILWLIFFSIFGVLARLGLEALENFNGKSIEALVWVQFVGCVVMGTLSETKPLFNLADNTSLQIYVGITTGFCGSFTTFSSWMKSIFLSTTNALPHYSRPRGYDFMEFMNEIIITLSFSLMGIRFGAHIGIAMMSLQRKLRKVCDKGDNGTCLKLLARIFVLRQKYRKSNSILTIVSIFRIAALILGLGCWVGAILMAIFIRKWRGIVLFAIVFGPLGTLTRWMLSRKLNQLKPSFPVGTFIANVLGTILIGIFTIGQQKTKNEVACQVFQGLMDGLCGCLTTVSTFALELLTLQRGNAWIYGSTSVIIGFISMILTLGILHWGAATLHNPVC
ncbi:CrcB-like protein-domain-containing protein [Dipodascopsis uninucleata]